MDVVVNLALAVLGVVFLFSLFILIIMCRRKCEYKRLTMDHSLRLSKLRQDQLDDVIQLSPYISQTLSSNKWVEEVSGLLQHCVAVLKISHIISDRLAKVPLGQLNPQMNDLICRSTSMVAPRFDELLRALAAPNVDIRLIEARVIALTTTCWALVSPFYLINPKYKETFGVLIAEMEMHQRFLQTAVKQAEFGSPNVGIPTSEDSPKQEILSAPAARKPIEETKPPVNLVVLQKNPIDNSSSELLNEEAPADPVN